MEFPDLSDYFRHLAGGLQSPIDFCVSPMPDRILVVDDEEPIREIVASMLGTAGYACKQAASGMEALAVLTSGEEFELMLSDLMMADLDGIGLLERTKEKVSRHAGRHGYRRARYLGRAGRHSGTELTTIF